MLADFVLEACQLPIERVQLPVQVPLGLHVHVILVKGLAILLLDLVYHFLPGLVLLQDLIVLAVKLIVLHAFLDFVFLRLHDALLKL